MDFQSDLFYATTRPTSRDIIQSRIRSRQKWTRRRFWLRLRVGLFGRSQLRMPENRSCQSARSSSPILRNVTSGTAKT